MSHVTNRAYQEQQPLGEQKPLLTQHHDTQSMNVKLPRAPLDWFRGNTFGTLRTTTLLIIGVTLVGLMLTLYVTLSAISLAGFDALEQQRTRDDAERAINALSNDLARMRDQTLDYAVWDDTYAFVQNGNPTYVEKNLYDKVFVDMKLNMMLFVDVSGRVVYGKGFDLEQGHAASLPEDIGDHLTVGDLLVGNAVVDDAKTGIILLRQGPMLITASPILTSEAKGPVHGTLIWGRFLNSARVNDLATLTRLSLDMRRLDDSHLPGDFEAVRGLLSDQAPVAVRALNDDQIGGYAMIKDLYGHPALVLRVDQMRVVYAQGRAVNNHLGLALLVAGVVFGAVTLLLLERTVLSRLAGLSANVSRIGASGDLALRVPYGGNDELAHLANDINRMLEAIEQAQHERQEVASERARIQEEHRIVQARREFVSIVSHELRTPLTPINGYVDMLLRDKNALTERQHHFLQVIKQNIMHMLSLIDDLLDFGRLEASAVTLKIAPMDLAATVRSIVELTQPLLDNKHLDLQLEIDNDVPVIEADQKRIAQILTNLITNAIKYTLEDGQIRINVALRDNEYVQVQVADTGIGLTPEQQSKLFNRFYRADNGLQNQIVGTGLGLMIARSLVDLHGGTISVRSEVNVGSVFTFRLPIHQPRLSPVVPQEVAVRAE